MLVHRWSRSGLLLDTPNKSPICQFWYPRVLGSPHTTRKPLLLLPNLALLLLREAERQLLGLLFHEPPRFECLPQNQLSGFLEVWVGKMSRFGKYLVANAKYRHVRGGQPSFESIDSDA